MHGLKKLTRFGRMSLGSCLMVLRCNNEKCPMLGHELFLSTTFRDFVNNCSETMVDAAIVEALVKVKADYKDVSIAQQKYGYAEGSWERADRNLVVVMLNAPCFPWLEHIVSSSSLLSL